MQSVSIRTGNDVAPKSFMAADRLACMLHLRREWPWQYRSASATVVYQPVVWSERDCFPRGGGRKTDR